MTFEITPSIKTLLEMLEYARPHRSWAEAEFVEKYISPLLDEHGGAYDKFGNAVLRIGTAPVLWSCHTDTVHHKPGRQEIALDGDGLALVSLFNKERGMCLGADDGAGVWLMSEMIQAKVPGLYIFHAGEESAGLGSSFIRDNHASDWFKDIKCAIALDRKGTRSIITHQFVGRACSDEFGLSLAKKLNLSMECSGWKLDDTGTFTDTAHYVDHIGECTNISVGYYLQHTQDETLDIEHLLQLRNGLLAFDCDGLVFSRKPGDPDDDMETNWEKWAENFTVQRKGANSNIKLVKGGYVGSNTSYGMGPHEVYDEALVQLCGDYPEVAARLIERLGGNVADLIELCEEEGFDV